MAVIDPSSPATKMQEQDERIITLPGSLAAGLFSM